MLLLWQEKAKRQTVTGRSSHSDTLMDIQCPACAAQFHSPVDIRGKLVQCGSCKQRFTVDDKTVISVHSRAQDDNDEFLSRLARTGPSPTAVPGTPQPTFQQAMYQNMDGMTAADVMPLEPKYLISIGVGVVAILFGIIVFVVSGGEGGGMQDFDDEKRWVIAGFLAAVGSALIFFGNQKSRKKGVLFSLLLAGPLLAMPLLFPQVKKAAFHRDGYSEVRQSVGGSDEDDVPDLPEPEAAVIDLEAFKKEISWEKVEKALRSEINSGSSIDAAQNSVYAVYLRGMSARHKFNVRDFLMQRSLSPQAGIVYERGDGKWLIVGRGMQVPLESLAESCLRIGAVDDVYPQLRVIEVSIDPAKLAAVNSKALTDSSNDDFYLVNLAELNSIDPARVRNAVRRLAAAEPRMQRRRVRDKMIALAIADPDNEELLDSIGKALPIWAIEGDSSARLLMDSLLPKIEKATDLPRSLVDFASHRQNAKIVPAVVELWKLSPIDHEKNMIALGQQVEDAVLPSLSGEYAGLKQSAVRVLTATGTQKSLSALTQLRASASEDFRRVIDRAISEITDRQ